MTSRAGVLVAALATLLLAACGSSQPSSDVGVLTASPGASSASTPSAPAASGDSSASPSPASAPPASQVVANGPPAKPGKPTFKHVKTEAGPAQGTTIETYRITWTEPNGTADSFVVYGLPDCLRSAKKYDGTPCVVKGMKIPADKLVLLGAVPGDQRSIDVSWQQGEIGGGPYSTILVRATNSAGNSIFTIVHSDDVCFGCVY